jgi:cytochrome P450
MLKEQEFAGSFDAIQQDHYRRIIFPLHGIVRSFQDIFTNQKTIKQHIQTLDDFIYGIIKERRLQQEKTPDMDTDTYKTDLLLRFMKAKSPKGELYTDKELRDTMLNLIIAGRDTSAQTISWFFYNVLKYPQVEEKLLQEIEEFITADVEKDTVKLYEAIQKMKYSHAV